MLASPVLRKGQWQLREGREVLALTERTFITRLDNISVFI